MTMTRYILGWGRFALLATGVACCGITHAAEVHRPVKVFILAGDENCLEQGVVANRSDGNDAAFFTDATPVKDERATQVNCAIYKGAYVAGTDSLNLTPEATGVVGLGEARKGKKAVPLVPFPELSQKEGYTTVLRGYFSVMRSGEYEVMPGEGESAFNVTTVGGKEVYRREVGQSTATVTRVELGAKKRHGFETLYFKRPGPQFRIPQVNIPGTLERLVAEKKPYALLRDAAGKWAKRDDVILYDAHPILNETRAAGHPLAVAERIGPELMLGQVLGNHFTEPVFLLRFATRHPVWFLRGSRSLGHDYLPPSSGGDPNFQGSWDVIHFNFGVWDATYREESSKFYKGRHTTSVADYEKNLRQLVARMKQTGATLIWATVTPVWEGEPGKPNADEDAFNVVAAQVMKENGVIVDDLNAEVRRQGHPKTTNVHDVGNLAPKVTETILAALDGRKNNTKPLPRVLMIGDSITGTYIEQVTRNLDGKAAVFKNPGNAEDTWNGVARIEPWLDLKQYLQSGQEYLELVNSVKDALAQMARFNPGYQNQGAELAGLVWFQGLADSQSPAHTAAYERNLANLIRDVRRDLNTPHLPVVVAAVPYGDGKVHAAQMAVGDPAKHPEFSGNVAVIDTLPFVFPKEQSPGGRDSDYANNAESFLRIGESMGKAMVELQPK